MRRNPCGATLEGMSSTPHPAIAQLFEIMGPHVGPALEEETEVDEDEITQVRPLVDMLPERNTTAPRAHARYNHVPFEQVHAQTEYAHSRATATRALVYALTHWAPLEYDTTEEAVARLRESAFTLVDVTDTEHSEWTYTHEGRELHVSQIGATLVLR